MSNIITDINQLDLNGNYTYADYLLWKFKERVELIKGKILQMSPAPSTNHQKLVWKLMRQLDIFFHNSSCQMFVAPFDVRLINFKKSTENNQVRSVVQPDLCVICDESKIDEKGCLGSPDLIIEILSPGNSKKEMSLKFDLYEENDVREYWLVDSMEKVVYIYILENGKYIGLKPFIEDFKIQSHIFPEFSFELKEIFDGK